jgi:hypothetical protein
MLHWTEASHLSHFSSNFFFLVIVVLECLFFIILWINDRMVHRRWETFSVLMAKVNVRREVEARSTTWDIGANVGLIRTQMGLSHPAIFFGSNHLVVCTYLMVPKWEKLLRRTLIKFYKLAGEISSTYLSLYLCNFCVWCALFN